MGKVRVKFGFCGDKKYISKKKKSGTFNTDTQGHHDVLTDRLGLRFDRG